MRAAVLHAPFDVRVEEVPYPSLGERDVLIRGGACGVCGTDIHFFRGEWSVHLPLIPGHEFSGTVKETGSGVTGLKPGDRVVAEPNIVCGNCHYCRLGEPNFFCENLSAIGVDRSGAFSGYVAVPATNVYKIPEALSLDEAALIEPLACSVRGIQQAGVKTGDRVAVIGAGPMGLMLTQLARLSGATEVVVSDLLPVRLEKALELGADHVVNIVKEDLVQRIGALTHGLGVDVAIEAVGKPETILEAISAARRGGRVNIFGVCPQDALLTVKPFDLYHKELTLTASYRSPWTFEKAVAIASSGKVRLKPLITHVFELGRIKEALQVAETGKGRAVKVLVRPEKQGEA